MLFVGQTEGGEKEKFEFQIGLFIKISPYPFRPMWMGHLDKLEQLTAK
jgi:hypothetical protein